MTALLCQIVPTHGELRYVNAGHPAGRLTGPGGLVRLGPTGPPLGVLPDSRWEAPSLDVRTFTLGLLFTDGVAEALEAEGDPDAILDDLARRLAAGTPEAACTAVMDRVRHAGPSPSLRSTTARRSPAFRGLAVSETAALRAEPTAPEGRRPWMVAFVGAALFVVALFVLQRELSAFRYHDLTGALFEIPLGPVALALLLTAANYLVLAGYDVVAFAWARLALDRRRVAAVSLVSYAIAHSVDSGCSPGPPSATASTRAGASARPTCREWCSSTRTTSLVGFLTLGGLSLALAPLPALAALPRPGASGRRRHPYCNGGLRRARLHAAPAAAPLRPRAADARPPPDRRAIPLVDPRLDARRRRAVGALPAGRVGFVAFAGAFLAAQLLGS